MNECGGICRHLLIATREERLLQAVSSEVDVLCEVKILTTHSFNIINNII